MSRRKPDPILAAKKQVNACFDALATALMAAKIEHSSVTVSVTLADGKTISAGANIAAKEIVL